MPTIFATLPVTAAMVSFWPVGLVAAHAVTALDTAVSLPSVISHAAEQIMVDLPVSAADFAALSPTTCQAWYSSGATEQPEINNATIKTINAII